ncbi:MAG: gluconokinase [Ferruginibacter sp.]
MQYHVIYIMGVSGSGKTTIGKQLSERTGYSFYDADNFHTKENIAKMNAGNPLTDEERWPWLENIHDFVSKTIGSHNIILVCSALREVYRRRLSRGIEDKCRWVFLQGDYNTIQARLNLRKDHYMPVALLKSQFDTLEIPANAITADILLPPEDIVDSIISKIIRSF